MRWSRQILFGDVDAMFASAAVVKDPSLAGKPIAVGGPPPHSSSRAQGLRDVSWLVPEHPPGASTPVAVQLR